MEIGLLTDEDPGLIGHPTMFTFLYGRFPSRVILS